MSLFRARLPVVALAEGGSRAGKRSRVVIEEDKRALTRVYRLNYTGQLVGTRALHVQGELKVSRASFGAGLSVRVQLFK